MKHDFINLFRALAALWVLLSHCMIWGGWQGLPLPSAKLAVDLFMVVSGYVMAASARPGPALHFWTRRFFRIAPLYYVVLALTAIAAPLFLGGLIRLQALNPHAWPGNVWNPAHADFSATNLAWHASFLFGLIPSRAASTMLPDWSLSLEAQFYLAFPFVLGFLSRNYVRGSILLAALAYTTAFWARWNYHWPELSLLPFKLQYFLAGILLFEAMRARRWMLAAIAMGLVCMEGVGAMAALLACMLALGLAGDRARWLVSSRPVTFASDVSYGVYLSHGFWIAACGFMPAVLALPGPQRVATMVAIVVPGTYLTAYCAHRLVEIPGIALGKRLLLHRPLRRAPPVRVTLGHEPI